MDKFSFLNAAHTGFIADLYDQYLQNPDAVEPSWRSFFQGYDLANENYSLKDSEEETVSSEIPEEVKKEFLVDRLNQRISISWAPVHKNKSSKRKKTIPTYSRDRKLWFIGQ